MSITSLGCVAKRAGFVALVLASISPATPASAGPPARCEAGVGLQAGIPTFGSTYTTNYQPQLLHDPVTGGAAGQQIALTSGTGPALEIGIACFPGAHVGVQVLVSQEWLGLPGVSSPYTFRIEYTSRPPPYYNPIPVVIDTSTPWPDTTGSLHQVGLSLNGICRTGERHGVSATISGGLTWQRTSAAIERVAYTASWLGGHSVRFEQDLKLRLVAEPATGLGFNIGGDVRFAIGERALVAVTYRYVRTGEVSMPMKVDSIVNAYEGFLSGLTRDSIQAGLQPPPLTVTPAFSRVGASFLVRF